jgi:hypothetical protein
VLHLREVGEEPIQGLDELVTEDIDLLERTCAGFALGAQILTGVHTHLTKVRGEGTQGTALSVYVDALQAFCGIRWTQEFMDTLERVALRAGEIHDVFAEKLEELRALEGKAKC